MKNYLSARQVVARLNGAISVKLVYRLVQQGKLRANRQLGKVLIEEESLLELLEGPRPAVPSMVSTVKPRARGAKTLW
jgi:hypothetical protein